MTMSNEFQDRVAVVTGGSRGIGRATALQLARNGADVAISYGSRIEPANDTVAAIQATGRQAIAVQCDVKHQDQVDRLFAEARKQLGPIDLLAHCGAISNIASHEQMTFELWSEMIDANLHGAFRVMFAVKDEMIQRRFGRIVMLSSVAALRGRALQIHYAAAKAGVIALTRCCSDAFAPHNVRVNCVAPGLIETEMAHVLSKEQIASIEQQTPMGRLGRPEELAEMICFLLSERSSFTTGQTMIASGGRITIP